MKTFPIYLVAILMAAVVRSDTRISKFHGETSISFAKMGKVSPNSGWAHMKITLNFSRMEAEIKQMLQQPLPEFVSFFKNKEADKAQAARVQEANFQAYLNSVTSNALEKLKLIQQAVSPQVVEAQSRVKRGWLDGIFGLVGLTISTIITETQLSVLGSRVSNVETEVDNMITVVQDHESQIAHMKQDLEAIHAFEMFAYKRMSENSIALQRQMWFSQVNEKVLKIHLKLNELSTIVNMAMVNRLSVNIMSFVDITQPLKALKASAEKKGFKLLPNYQAHLHQLESSILVQGDEFSIVTHVPMLKEEEMYDLFQHTSMPLSIGSSKLDLKLEHENSYLALQEHNKDSHFKEYSNEELSKCQKYGELYICDTSVLSAPSQVSKSCLASLFNMQLENVRTNCRYTFVPKSETLFQIDANTFISNTELSQLQAECLKQTPLSVGKSALWRKEKSTHSLSGHQEIQADPNCKFETPAHKFFSSNSIYAKKQFNTFKIPSHMIFEQDTSDLTIQEVEDAYEQMKRTSESPVHVRNIYNTIKHNRAMVLEGKWSLIIGVGVVIAAIFSVVPILLYSQLKRKMEAFEEKLPA